MTIVERLRAGARLVLDGGTGSELQRRGVDVLQQVTKQLKAWSAVANLTHADVVQQVHQDYLRMGADYYPSRIARFASDWLGAGAQIVGGCCASGPEHIAAIRRVVSAA